MPQIFICIRKEGGLARLSYLCVIKHPRNSPLLETPFKKNNDFKKNNNNYALIGTLNLKVLDLSEFRF